MVKKKTTISIDADLLELMDDQRGNEKRSTYINSIISEHFTASPNERGGGTFVTTLELRETLKPIYDKLVVLEGLAHDVKELQNYMRSQ